MNTVQISQGLINLISLSIKTDEDLRKWN